jgi:outer membrane protein TolC
MLSFGVQNDSFTTWNVGKMETSWYQIMLSQTFPWPGKASQRGDAAALGADIADQNLARVRLTTEADARRAYWSLVLARDRLELLDRLETIYGRSATLARSRYEVGEAAQSDVLRAQLELNRLKQRRWALQVDRDTALQTLNRLRGKPLAEPIETPVHLAEASVPALWELEPEVQDALERSPELAAARLGIHQAEQLVGLAHKSYWPDITVTLGVMPRGGEFPPMWLATVGVPIPIFAGSKQSRAVAEADARVLVGQKNTEALDQILRLRTAQRHSALAAALDTIQIYRGGLLVQSETTADSTLRQYEVGRVTFASVLEANAVLVADLDGYLLALAQAQELAIEAAEVSLSAVPRTAGGSGGGMSSSPGPSGAGMTNTASAPSSASATSSGM